MSKDEKYHGKNILSYQPHTIFTGKEIKSWIQYHTTHETSKSKMAKKMLGYMGIDDDGRYVLIRESDRSSARLGKYIVERAKF